MSNDLAEMFKYNDWANRELFRACSLLTEAQLDTHIQGISGTVRELLMHIAGGPQTFVLRTKGRQHEGELERQSLWPGIETVIHIVESTSDELIAIAEKLADKDDEVELPYEGRIYHYPKRFFLVHAMEHGIEHRTEVKLALACMGIETPDLDGWNYAQSRGYGQ